MRFSRLRRLTIIAAFMASSLVVAVPGPASAALPGCVQAKNFWQNQQRYQIPIDWGASIECVMSQGHNHWGVYELQETLRDCYGQSIVPDLAFGPKTRDALMNAQRIHGITVDGIYGPQTRRTILWKTLAGCYRFR